jgi:hypothetical protein
MSESVVEFRLPTGEVRKFRVTRMRLIQGDVVLELGEEERPMAACSYSRACSWPGPRWVDPIGKKQYCPYHARMFERTRPEVSGARRQSNREPAKRVDREAHVPWARYLGIVRD